MDWVCGQIALGSQKENNIDKLQPFLSRLIQTFEEKLEKAGFLSANVTFLKEDVDLANFIQDKVIPTNMGRPKKDFSECSDRVQSRKANELLKEVGHDVIFKAAE